MSDHELAPVVPPAIEEPVVEVGTEPPSVEVLAEKPVVTPVLRVTAEGVVLSKVVVSPEGVILKVED